MLKKTTNISLLMGALALAGGAFAPQSAYANDFYVVQQTSTLKGTVVDAEGVALTGASVAVVGTTNGTNVDNDGNFTLKGVKKGAKVQVSFIGYQSQTIVWDGISELDIVLLEEDNMLGEAVVTAMGIVRKATSLTYATQQIKSDDLMKVQDPNLVNGLDGKISGVTITPGAGGAGGASKILLRGNKSIQGNNDPLIVVDGVPMNNSRRSSVDGMNLATTASTEGGDALSQINPDDIESINVLKGANAAALYGSRAANGVLMITTKKGKEGKLDVSFTSNVTMDKAFVTPEIQNVYGATITPSTFDDEGNLIQTGSMSIDSWGAKMTGEHTTYTANIKNNPYSGVLTNDTKIYKYNLTPNADGSDLTGAQILSQVGINPTRDIYLRNYGADDIADFFNLGVTTNNSVSLSGGTEKVRSYVSYANSHANGMLENNKYNRHTFAFRQHYKLFNRLTMDANFNYVQSKTENRIGGGKVGNPMFDLYTMPRNVDFGYYKANYKDQSKWLTAEQRYYPSGSVSEVWARVLLTGESQNWIFQSPMYNNPYWIMNQNTGVEQDDRFYGNFQANLDLGLGFAVQGRVSLDYDKYNKESHKSATTWDPANLNDYGRYWLYNASTTDVYTDWLLSYNRTFKEDWTVGATAGWVGHTTKGTSVSTDCTATVDMIKAGIVSELSTVFNRFDPSSGGNGVTSKGKSSNWDKAALFTAQIGWKDAVYVDGSYRMDWYRAFRQARFVGGANDAKDHYGYFGVGANTILTNLFKLGEPVSYLKYRISYSEVGNSIPNSIFDLQSSNSVTGGTSGSKYNAFTPKPETMKSFETGIESQFFNNALNVDVTYYNSRLDNAYIVISGQNGKSSPLNSACVRNQGVELTVGYDWQIGGGWRWKTSVNFSYNDNKILETYKSNGIDKPIDVSVAQGVKVRYIKGEKYGDMYVNDFTRWSEDIYQAEDGTLNAEGNGKLVHKAGDIYVNSSGAPSFDGNLKYLSNSGKVITKSGSKYSRCLGNMNSKYQLSWSNTFSYKNFNLFFLINGRIGGKVISLTEAYLDQYGVSQRTADARLAAEAQNILYTNADGTQVPGMYINDGRDLVPVQTWYKTVGEKDASSYVYNATNFRLRELSFGYTFRDVFGEGKNLSLSFIGRNLFYIYKDAPVDPDVSLSSKNGLGGFEMFNLPSTRNFGFNLKVNF